MPHAITIRVQLLAPLSEFTFILFSIFSAKSHNIYDTYLFLNRVIVALTIVALVTQHQTRILCAAQVVTVLVLLLAVVAISHGYGLCK